MKEKLINLSRVVREREIHQFAGTFLVFIAEGIIFVGSGLGILLSFGYDSRQFLLFCNFIASVVLLVLNYINYLILRKNPVHKVAYFMPCIILCIYHIQMILLGASFLPNPLMSFIGLLLFSYLFIVCNTFYQLYVISHYKGVLDIRDQKFKRRFYAFLEFFANPLTCFFVLAHFINVPNGYLTISAIFMMIIISSLFSFAPIAAYDKWQQEKALKGLSDISEDTAR